MSDLAVDRYRKRCLFDRLTAIPENAKVPPDELARVAFLSALVALGLSEDAEQVDPAMLTGSDALAALGLLLAVNSSKIGPAAFAELDRIGREVCLAG